MKSKYDKYSVPELLDQVAEISQEIKQRLLTSVPEVRLQQAKDIRELGIMVQKRLTFLDVGFGCSLKQGIYPDGMRFSHYGVLKKPIKHQALNILREVFGDAPHLVDYSEIEVFYEDDAKRHWTLKVPFIQADDFTSKGIYPIVFGEFTNAELCKPSEE